MPRNSADGVKVSHKGTKSTKNDTDQILLCAFLCVLCVSVADVATVEGQAIKIGGGADEYEGIYGKPEHWPLRDMALGSMPEAGRAFWTQGLLSVLRSSRQPGRSAVDTVRLCVPEESLCIPLDRPAPEIRDNFFEQARSHDGDLAIVTGVFVGPETTSEGAVSGFMFWRIEWGPPPQRHASGDRPAIEDIVRDPGRFAGRRVTIEGCFRGDRWPEAEASARPGGEGWVLSDGPFHVWVMGEPARGRGWKLGTADAHHGFVIEATGTVQRSGDGVYLGAKSVRLMKKNETRCP